MSLLLSLQTQLLMQGFGPSFVLFVLFGHLQIAIKFVDLYSSLGREEKLALLLNAVKLLPHFLGRVRCAALQVVTRGLFLQLWRDHCLLKSYRAFLRVLLG